MKKTKFALIIQNNLFYIVLLANFLFDFTHSYYIFPFKILKPELSELYKELPDNTKEEVYFSYLNLVTMYTYVKAENSKIYELIFKESEKCSFPSNISCITNYKNNIFEKFGHKNKNIMNIMNYIMDSPPKEECTNIKIGLALPGYSGKDKCVSMVNEIKKNDNTVNTTAYSFKFYDEQDKKDKGFDGELVMGVEPDEIEPNIYNKSDFIYANSFFDEYYYEGPWDGKYLNFSFLFAKVYYYQNNSKKPENIIYINATQIDEGAIDFEIGLNKCPYTYFMLIKINYFDPYIKENKCKETFISGGFYGILCDKKKINKKELSEKIPILYFYNVDLNYEFILDSNDLFLEEDDTIYFTLISRNEILNNWRFGQLFLKKYRLVFNIEKKAIGYYIKHKEIPRKENTEEKPKLSLGMIILIIGLVLLVVEVVAAIICIKKCNCINRRKRANELMDDNYDYPAVNPEDNKLIN